MNPTTDITAIQQLVTTMSEQIASLTRTLGEWMLEQPHTLAEVEQHLLRLLKQFGASLLTSLCALAAPSQPSPTLACPCGKTARFQRCRKALVITLLGPLSFERPYYLCQSCGVGQHPLDTQLQVCAGSRSAALDELLALLGATQDSFAQAAVVLERLTLVHLCPNSVRAATQDLGALLLAQQTQSEAAETANSASVRRVPPVANPSRLYISMDGVMAHLHQRGWSEFKVGCCYLTRSCTPPKQPERLEIRAHSSSYVTTLAQAHSFGWQLWEEAVRRGALTAQELVVLGDGSHWIWTIADTHFPGATQIVDWYHASSYIWEAASALWNEQDRRREEWAKQQLDALWEGKLEEVLAELRRHSGRGEAIEAALSYYTTHQGRMDYAAYRGRGMQIGSGSAESSCKQLISARLKQAGMIWEASGAEAVAVVRAWLKSERWEEALALRGVRRRSYRRKQAEEKGQLSEEEGQPAREQARGSGKQEAKGRKELSAEVLSAVRTELAEQRGKNVWGKPWSVQRLRELAAQREQSSPAIAA